MNLVTSAICFLFFFQFCQYSFAAEQGFNKPSGKQILPISGRQSSASWEAAELQCRESGEYREITVAYEVDSAFCAKFAFETLANSNAVQLIENATYPFMTQFCINLQPVLGLVYCEENADRLTDPYLSLPSDSSAALDVLQNFWESSLRAEAQRDITILLTGQDVGAASIQNGMCTRESQYIVVSNPTAVDIAREFAHTLGVEYLSSGSGIMNVPSTLNPANLPAYQFSPSEVLTINNFLRLSGSCIEGELNLPQEGEDCSEENVCGNGLICWPSSGKCRYYPESWTCDLSWFDANDDCDCGCSLFDPDCSNTELSLYCGRPFVGPAPDGYICDAFENQCVIGTPRAGETFFN